MRPPFGWLPSSMYVPGARTIRLPALAGSLTAVYNLEAVDTSISAFARAVSVGRSDQSRGESESLEHAASATAVTRNLERVGAVRNVLLLMYA
jgi:hypothetical protein